MWESYDPRTVPIAKLFSDGKLMETYGAVNEGKMEGHCYRFLVRKDVKNMEVMVCDTFGVERVRRYAESLRNARGFTLRPTIEFHERGL